MTDHGRLAALGLTVQLGHFPGAPCLYPIPGPVDFMVLHTNGWHPVNIAYCQCNQATRPGTQIQQLLRYELYPATTGDPTTCATFRALEMYHILTLQSKITVYDYYLSMNNLTDNTGVDVNWVS